MIQRQRIFLTASLLTLPFLTGCLAPPVNGTVEVTHGYAPGHTVVHSPPTMYEVQQPVVQYQAPPVSMPTPSFTVQQPMMQVHTSAPSMPVPKVKMSFGGLFGGGPKMSMKAKGGPKMSFKPNGKQTIKVTTSTSVRGSSTKKKTKITSGGKKSRGGKKKRK